MKEKIMTSLKARQDIIILEQREDGDLFGVHFSMPDLKNPGKLLHGYAVTEGEACLGKTYSPTSISLDAYIGSLYRTPK